MRVRYTSKSAWTRGRFQEVGVGSLPEYVCVISCCRLVSRVSLTASAGTKSTCLVLLYISNYDLDDL